MYNRIETSPSPNYQLLNYSQNSAAASAPAPMAPWTCRPAPAPAELEVAAPELVREPVALPLLRVVARLVSVVVAEASVGLEKVVLRLMTVPVPTDEPPVTSGGARVTTTVVESEAEEVVDETLPVRVLMAAVVEAPSERMVAVPVTEEPPESENRPE